MKKKITNPGINQMPDRKTSTLTYNMCALLDQK